MDMLCPKCAEPWDNDEFHDVASENQSTYSELAADFRRRGCEALGSRHGDGDAHPVIAATYDLLGDDMDGAAAMFEDMR